MFLVTPTCTWSSGSLSIFWRAMLACRKAFDAILAWFQHLASVFNDLRSPPLISPSKFRAPAGAPTCSIDRQLRMAGLPLKCKVASPETSSCCSVSEDHFPHRGSGEDGWERALENCMLISSRFCSSAKWVAETRAMPPIPLTAFPDKSVCILFCHAEPRLVGAFSEVFGTCETPSACPEYQEPRKLTSPPRRRFGSDRPSSPYLVIIFILHVQSRSMAMWQATCHVRHVCSDVIACYSPSGLFMRLLPCGYAASAAHAMLHPRRACPVHLTHICFPSAPCSRVHAGNGMALSELRRCAVRASSYVLAVAILVVLLHLLDILNRRSTTATVLFCQYYCWVARTITGLQRKLPFVLGRQPRQPFLRPYHTRNPSRIRFVVSLVQIFTRTLCVRRLLIPCCIGRRTTGDGFWRLCKCAGVAWLHRPDENVGYGPLCCWYREPGLQKHFDQLRLSPVINASIVTLSPFFRHTFAG